MNPWFSHQLIIQKISMLFITCESNLLAIGIREENAQFFSHEDGTIMFSHLYKIKFIETWTINVSSLWFHLIIHSYDQTETLDFGFSGRPYHIYLFVTVMIRRAHRICFFPFSYLEIVFTWFSSSKYLFHFFYSLLIFFLIVLCRHVHSKLSMCYL